MDPGVEEPFPVCWERCNDQGNLTTLVCDPHPHGGMPILLAHVPTYGIYHRLVMTAPSTLTWSEDTVFRLGKLVIRFHTGSLSGEHQGNLETVSFDGSGGTVVETDGIGTETRTGRFIEIVADGDSHEHARLRSSSITGLLAVVLGNSAIGNITFSDPYEAEAGSPQQGFYQIPNYSQRPWAIDETSLDAIDAALRYLTVPSRMNRAIELALHWLDRGLRSRTVLDELICYFVGIEAILNSYSKEFGPLPKQVKRSAIAKELKVLIEGAFEEDVRESILRSINYVSTRERFDFYAEKRNLAPIWSETFKKLASARNSVLHGEPISITEDDSSNSRHLLLLILKAEMELDLDLPWEIGSQLTSVKVVYDLASFGYHGNRR